MNPIYKAGYLSFFFVGWLFIAIQIYFVQTNIYPDLHLSILFMFLAIICQIAAATFGFTGMTSHEPN